jgi:uncharacterized protein YndB with AHSA1/START domain
MRRMRHLLPAALTLLCLPAGAEVLRQDAGGFEVRLERQLAAPPSAAYAALVKIGDWWSDAHTWSGKAANMRITLAAGGCFCERWDTGEAEHGRVLQFVRDRTLRLAALLGPLQTMPVAGVLDFQLQPAGQGTQLVVSYRISGNTPELAALPKAVDGVLAEQLDRLVRLVATGRAAAP